MMSFACTKVPTSNFRSIEVRRYLDVRVARSTSVLFEVSMSNLPPRVSHQERCCLVMCTTPLPFLKKSGLLATLRKGMWMRTRLISNQKITYIQLVSSPIYSGTGRTPSLLRIEACGVAGGISEYLLHREAGSLN